MGDVHNQPEPKQPNPAQLPVASDETSSQEQDIVIRRSLKERLYEHFRNVPVKYIDWFIGACVVAIVVFIILGMLKGRGAF